MSSSHIFDEFSGKGQPWTPIPHAIIKDDELRQRLHEEGYVVVPFANSETIHALRNLYEQHHQFGGKTGGMFYSVYSEDTNYRKTVHSTIGSILQPILDRLLVDYKMVLNSFIVKAPGPQSEFFLHQDSTGTDEFFYSVLSIWLPLQDIDESNGAMCVIPKSHKLFSPYRGISIKAPFENAIKTARRFLRPIYLKAGEAILFDNRILHNSMQNCSNSPRVVVMSASLPIEAPLIVCHKNNEQPDGLIELIQQSEDYLFENINFLQNCHLRPNGGNTVKWVKDEYPKLSDEELLTEFAQNGIVPVDFFSAYGQPDCNMIGEPVCNSDKLIASELQKSDSLVVSKLDRTTMYLRKFIDWFTTKSIKA